MRCYTANVVELRGFGAKGRIVKLGGLSQLAALKHIIELTQVIAETI